MIVVCSSNGKVGIQEAMRVLKAGGSALDAVEAGIRQVEANPEDHSVGYGGYPNILGEVELDAAIMNGDTLEAGAVGALRGYRHPISVARKVMECLPHVFLVGHGAERFAAEMGFEPQPPLTAEAHRTWKERLLREMTETELEQLSERADLWRWVKVATDPERAGGTVNFIALDARGQISVGVSTSGWAWKYPGRLGDSPVIGAGLYADSRYGAAACTGMGEMALRLSTARSVVLYLQMGLSLSEAAQRAMEDFKRLGGHYLSAIQLIAVDRCGNHVGLSNTEGTTYLVLTDEMTEPVELSRRYVPMEMRWLSSPVDKPLR